MMEQQLKERLVGATVLVVLAIIVIPVVLDGPGNDRPAQQRLDLPDAQADSERRTVRIALDEPAASGGETAPEEPPQAQSAATGQSTETDAEPEVEARDSVSDVASQDVTRKETVAARETTPESGSAPDSDTATASTQPWTVQVGSFSSEENAAGLVERLKSLGYADAFVSRYDDGSRIHYRVRVGGYADRDAAAARAAEIRGRSGEPARPAKN